MGVGQATVIKSIWGSTDYQTGKSYGGAAKKLIKAASKDKTIQSLLAEIENLQEEAW